MLHYSNYSCRLSLANDSDSILERMICMLPEDSNAPWHSIKDAYHANLWDINPSIKIAGIGQEYGEEGTVIIDGCFAANIRWKWFEQVAYTQLFSWRRYIATGSLYSSGYVFWTAVGLVGSFQGPGRFI